MRCQGQRTPILMFHDTIEKRDRNAQWFDCTTEEFQQLMQDIKDQGLTPVSLDQLYSHLTNGDLLPDKAIVLTFDDNYQGFYDRAYPILKQFGYPAVMFVHTGFVGNQEGLHPKMTWDELKELIKDPLITIGSHTITHPDLPTIDYFAQKKEIEESKRTLEEHLGTQCPYFAYPDGENNEDVQRIVKAAGYKMAFSIHNQPAEESPNIYCVGRYVHTRFKNAIEDCDAALRGGALGVVSMPLKDAPVSYREAEFAGVKLGLITGGKLVSRMSDKGREGVLEFIKRTPGAVGGINGGFFAMAAVASTDNQMVGPLKTSEMTELVPDESQERWEKLHNRPLVIWGPTSFGIVPFEPGSMRSVEDFRDFMPDFTDTFMAGVWLVHGGQAQKREDLDLFGAKDIEDPRKRAFFGVLADGTVVLGASLESASSEKVAEAAAAAGAQEAVLLDSGFSTSLVYGQSIKASGHSRKDNPSRPVPHALLVLGNLDPSTAALGAPDAVLPGQEEDSAPRHRRRRRR